MFNLKKLAASIRESRNEKGQGLVEYALILVLVAVVVIAALLLLGPQISGIFCRVTTALGGECVGGVRIDGPHQLHITPGLDAEYRCKALGLSGGEKWYEWLESPAVTGSGMVFSTSSTEMPFPNYFLNGSGSCP